MSQSEQGKKETLLSFGEFTLNLERRGLYRGLSRVHLTSKPLETLIFLIENRTRTVEKQEFFDAIWKDTFVTEDNLVHAIREIRRVLKDNKEDPHYVQTVPRRGYRFVAEVRTNEPASNFSDLEEAIAAPPSVAAPARKMRWVWLAAPVLALISILAWALLTRDSHNRVTPVAGEAHVGGIKNQITSGQFFSGKPAFSADGKFILYVSSEEDTRGSGDLFIRQFPEGNAQRITNKINPSGDLPVFTADGSHVVFSLPRIAPNGARHHDLWIVPSFGGPPTRFIEDASGAGFSPDQKWVAYTKYVSSGAVLWVSPVNDLTTHYEVAAPGYTPRWSPNGEWLAYSTGNPNQAPGDIRMCRVSFSNGAPFEISNNQQLTSEPENIYGLTWTADSRAIIFASQRSGAAQLYKVSVGDGLIKPVLTGVGQYIAPSASPDGTTLVFQYFRLANDLMTSSIESDSTGGNDEPRNITFDQFHLWPRISPSGEKLASVIREIDNAERLYLTDLKTHEGSQLSDRPARHPCWLNDVDIAFLSSDASSENTQILAVSTATRESRLLTTFHGRADWLAVHPDGTKLAVVVKGPDNAERIVLRNLINQSDSTIHQGSEYEYLRWSPDGSTLCWDKPGLSRDAPVVSDGIWVIPIGQSEPHLIAHDGYCPVWSKDGAAIYFTIRNGKQGLWRYDFGQQKERFVRAWESVYTFDISSTRLIFTQHKNNSQVYSMSIN